MNIEQAFALVLDASNNDATFRQRLTEALTAQARREHGERIEARRQANG